MVHCRPYSGSADCRRCETASTRSTCPTGSQHLVAGLKATTGTPEARIAYVFAFAYIERAHWGETIKQAGILLDCRQTADR